ncbi:MAG: M20/M25/M40 family metallo-hydrolase [Clostridia bacterium]|nr:M20/M25/M40 family metallo-hydrolase [Clostridia bacterium]
MINKENVYSEKLSRLIQVETISENNQTDKTKFYVFHDALREMFPNLFSVCEFKDFDGSFYLRWKGKTDKSPVMLMNHHDVVEATGKWTYPPFAGEIHNGKIYGRGTLDTKGGLFSMLQAAEELIENNFTPEQDTYFVSACTEETDGSGADAISNYFLENNIKFSFVLDEGGMILSEPIGGAKGEFAIVGVGEKGCADIKFIARSSGGHASTPGKNTPLVRLGKFMAEVEKSKLFKSELSPTVIEVFRRLSESMSGPLKFVLGHAKIFKPLLIRVMPLVSSVAGAMLRTTIAFTMAGGSEMANVLPHEAWIVGNMRFSHHQGGKNSIEAIKKLAEKYDIETEVLDPGFDSAISDYHSDAFRLVEEAVDHVFENVKTSPYIMTGASDCRYMSRISENCLRFVPFFVSDEQLDSIHGFDENLNISCLPKAVEFYKYILEASV